MKEEKDRYGNLDGLRTYAAIGVILMHVLTNGKYVVENFWIEHIILSFTDFVYLFMVISGFSMCCGYLEKIQKQQISLESFYRKRYEKIFPFFSVLIIMDVIISPSVNSLYEAFASLTLCFGLLPNANHTVIGVGWTLGVIFVFYLLFPFYSFLLSNKKRAWFALLVALFYNFACSNYYFNAEHMVEGYSYRTNFLFCSVYFMSGAMIYLYRKEICNSNSLIWFIIINFMIVAYYAVPTVLSIVGLNIALVGYAISKEERSFILNNKFTRFISGVSLEIYLCHMVIYRLFERLNLIYALGNSFFSYMIVSILTVIGAIVFAVIIRGGIRMIVKR